MKVEYPIIIQSINLCASHLPVNVQAIKLVGAEKLEGVIHEAIHAVLVGGEVLEGLGAERPATKSQHDLKME